MSHVARSSIIIAIFFGLDKILGFLRQILVARQFGLTYEIDVFNAANNIPDLLSALISGGALGVALIPVLSEYLETKGRPYAWELFARILNLAFLVTAGIAVIIIFLADPLVRNVIVPGFPPEQQRLTVQLMRLDLLAILIFSISGLVMAGLQANQHFLLPAMAPGLYNLGQILGIAVLAPSSGIRIGSLCLPAFGLGIHGLVYGVILGALFHLLIQVPGLAHFKFRWTAGIDLRNPGVQKVLKLLAPRIVTMFFLQLFFILRDNLASGMGEGAVTALNYGWFIMQVPETLIGSAFAIALLPTISELIARGETQQFKTTLNRAVRAMLSLTLPAAVLMAIALRPLVQVIFGFDPAGVDLVVWVTRAYLLGLAGHALLEIAARSFYAQQDAITPLLLAALNARAYLNFAVVFALGLGAIGIALANSAAFTFEALLLLVMLNIHFPGLLAIRRTAFRVLLACLAGGLLTYVLMHVPLPGLLPTMLALVAGGLVTLPFIWSEIKVLLRI